MKRIISLCCIALILVSSMAVPARAADFTGESNWIELLDFDSANAEGNSLVFSWDTYVDYSMPYITDIYFVDILFSYTSDDGTPLNGIYAAWGGATITLSTMYIGNNLYRAYGAIPAGHHTYLRLIFNSPSPATRYLTLFSVSVNTAPVEHYDTEGYCHIVSTLTEKLIHYVPTDEINYRYIDATGQAAYDCEFTLTLYVTDWQKYDYIDFNLLLSCESITSITASSGDTYLEFDINEWENSNLTLKDYRVVARLDLTGLNRATAETPTVVITGQWAPDLINLIQVLGISGYVDMTNINFLYLFLQRLLAVCNTGFINVGQWFVDLNSSIDEQTRRLELAFQGDTSGGDTSAGQQFQNDVAQKDQQLDQMAAVMDSVQKPNIDQINVSVDQYVSQSDIQVLASPMAVFFEGEIFSKIIIMSILLATVSYVLYGKR